MRRLGRPTTLLTLSLLILASACLAPGAVASDTIYWTTPYSGAPKVFSAKLDGTSATPTPINTTGASLNSAWGLGVDVKAGRLYWANYQGTKISYAKLDGSG